MTDSVSSLNNSKKPQQPQQSKLSLDSSSKTLGVHTLSPSSLAASIGDAAGGKINSEFTSGRKRVILPKGYSLLDWIRFTKQSHDLAGNQGILRRITQDELAKHDKEDDCWLAIYGNDDS